MRVCGYKYKSHVADNSLAVYYHRLYGYRLSVANFDYPTGAPIVLCFN